jgi:hypothetical protein
MTTTPLMLLLAVTGANGLLAGASLDQSIKQLPAPPPHRRAGVRPLQPGRRPGERHRLVCNPGRGHRPADPARRRCRPGRPPLHRSCGRLVGHDRCHACPFRRPPPGQHPSTSANGASGVDEAALAALFDRFQRWQTIRVSFQVTALAAVLTTLAVTVTQ